MFSVVVATFNRARSLSMTLESLLAQQAEFPYEIIVVDNNSSDETPWTVQAFEQKASGVLRYVFEGKQGLSMARNTGMAAARGAFIAFVDDDVIAESRWLQALADTYEAYPDAWVVGGKVMLGFVSMPPSWFDPASRILTTYLGLQDLGGATVKIEPPLALGGGNLSVRRDAYLSAGPFNTALGRIGDRLLSSEDTEFCSRVHRMGGGVYYCGKAVVLHRVPGARMTKRSFRARAYWEGRSDTLQQPGEFSRTSFRRFVQEGEVMAKDWVLSLAHYGIGQSRQALEHELGARKRLGRLQQFALSLAPRRAATHSDEPLAPDTRARSSVRLRPMSGAVGEPSAERIAHGVLRDAGRGEHGRGTWIRKLMEAVATDVSSEMATRSCVVLAPHPDDEVLGCGGIIAWKVRQGAHVSIIFLTDGRSGVAAAPDRASALREEEARRATAILGVPPERLVFLGFEDGRLRNHMGEAIESVRRTIASLSVSEVFVPYRREYHADHLAAWHIGSACRRGGMLLYEYPIWFGPYAWRRLGWRPRLAAISHLADMIHAVKVRITDVADVKQRALAAYRSQVAAFDREGTWGSSFLANFAGDYELFFTRR